MYDIVQKGVLKIIDFTPYREYLMKKGIKQQELIDKGIINTRVANQIKHNKSITLETLDKICDKLDCDFSDIVRHIKEQE